MAELLTDEDELIIEEMEGKLQKILLAKMEKAG